MGAMAIGGERKFNFLFVRGNVGGLILFFCHVFALAVAVIFFFGVMLQTRLSAKGALAAALRTAALFALPLALLAFVKSDHHAVVIGYEGKIRSLVALFMAQHVNL